MKRILALLLTISLIPLGVFSVFAEDSKLSRIYLDETGLKFEEQLVDSDGTWFAPMQEFASQLGVEVSWSFETETASLTKNSQVLQMSENSETAVLNGEEIAISGPMLKANSILYVPVRFVAETFGYDVSWDSEREIVTILSPNEDKDIGHYYDIVEVTCSGRQNDINVETNVLDMDYNTRWSCEPAGSYVTLELAEVSPVAYIGIAMYQGDERQSTISVQISEDGKNFKEVVTRYITSIMQNMEPIDLGGVYQAKYVRVLGYGNTLNEWNSITELRVYAPYEDGSMPVDQSGPDGATDGVYDDLSEDQKQVLEKMEACFDGVLPWLTNIYDQDEHGFYMAMSGKDDPQQNTAVEMTGWGINMIKNYTDMWADMPEEMRLKWIDYFNDRQDPVSGYFIDKQGPVNDRETARNQSISYSMVTSTLKGETRYVHPKDRAGDISSTEDAVMPDYMATVDSYIKWVESWNWDSNSWTAGDQTQQSLSYMSLLSSEDYELYKETLLNWFAEHQKSNGLWSDTINFNSISGLFKVGLCYNTLGGKIPNADKALESIAKCFEVDSPTAAHYVRNPLSVMVQIANYGPEYAEKVRQITVDNADIMLTYIEKFLCPDGGFSMYYQKSQSNFGGIYGSHQLWEGDIDSTMMVLIARNAIYSIFGVKAPKLHMDNFWEILMGEMDPPDPYDEKYKDLLYVVGGNGGEEDFESYTASSTPLSSFGGNTVSSSITAKIEKDRDRKDNNVLSLYYDGSQSSGPSFKIPLGDGSNIAQIKYIAQNDTVRVAEFEIKLVECSGAPHAIYINVGGSPAYALNFSGSGTLSLGSRVDSSNVAYGGNFGTIGSNDWYKIRIEYKQGTSAEDTEIKIYVDGELINTNSNYYGAASKTVPNSLNDEFTLTYYKAGKGTVYLDNFKIYNK